MYSMQIQVPLYKPCSPSLVIVFFAQSHVPEYRGSSLGPGMGIV